MIKRLRFKFVAITMGTLLIVFAVVFITLNVFMRSSSARQTEEMLKFIAAQDSFQFPEEETIPDKAPEQNNREHKDKNERGMMSMRFFYVKVDALGEITEANYEQLQGFSAEDAHAYAERVLSKGSGKGTIDHYQYLVQEKDYGHIIVFAERSMEIRLLSQLMRISAIVAAITCVLLFGLSILLSAWVVKPVKESFDRQKRFVSDASHELKTPLTIISTNADVLENEIGHNTRVAHIKSQCNRMEQLIRDLLTLARTEEKELPVSREVFDISQAILGTTLEFESQIFEDGKHLQYTIEENLTFNGNASQIRQLAVILIDNAARHSYVNGEIQIELKQINGKIVFSVYNTGPGVGPEEFKKIFERFYRSDQSRSRETGGYGLGLAIAKSIVDAHKGKIWVDSRQGEWIRFTVSF